MDTVKGIPALVDTDPAAVVGQYSRDLRVALLPTTGTVVAESGWAYGSPAPTIIRSGFAVALNGLLTVNAGFSLGGSLQQIASIPAAAYRPPGTRYVAAASGRGVIELVITTSGAISIRTRGGAAIAYTAGDYVSLSDAWVQS